MLNEHINLINSLLITHFGVDQADYMETLYAGLTSIKVYKVTVKEKSYVFKFRHVCDLKERQDERLAMNIAAQRDIAPKILYENYDDGIIVTDYLDSPLLSELVPLSYENLKLLAESIRKIHEGPVFNRTHSILDITMGVIQNLKVHRPSIVGQAIKVFHKIEHEMRDLSILKPCHNDLNPNNILFTREGIRIIDWEAAGQSDPFYDLACPIMTYEMDESQERTFLSSYFKRQPTEDEIHKLALFKRCHLIFYGCFYLFYETQIKGKSLLSEVDIAELKDPIVRSMELNIELLEDDREVQKYAHDLLRKAVEWDVVNS